MALTIGQIAALIHKDMCDDNDNGYSWDPRWGEDGKSWKTLTIEGRKFKYDRGSYECGTSVTSAWKAVFRGTKYEHCLDGYVYTGNAKEIYCSTGLFEWKPMSFLADPGDLYLNISNHVAMCQTQYPDVLSEFCINEKGGVYGGKVGDQTGKEAYVHDYYDYPWNGILHAKQITYAELIGEKPGSSTTTAKKTLDGVDIASWQDDNKIDVSKITADFVIIKVSGGTSYINPKWKENANKVLKAGKLLGLYHYACEYGKFPGGKAEAEYFLKQIKGFEGKAVLCLDWEEQAESKSISYAKEFLDTVAAKTGSTPLFYARAGYINEVSCSSIKKYPLWMASYLYRYDGGSGYVDNPVNTWGTGAWSKMTIYQYSSTRKISGYGYNIDVNKFYGTKEDWQKLAESNVQPEPEPEPKPATVTYTYVVVCDVLNVRDKRSSIRGKVVGKLKRGAIVKVKNLKKNSYGNTWAQIASGAYKGKYIATIFNKETLACKQKSVDTVAKEVIAGKWGNGEDRRKRLEDAGFNYKAVQARVNKLLS